MCEDDAGGAELQEVRRQCDCLCVRATAQSRCLCVRHARRAGLRRRQHAPRDATPRDAAAARTRSRCQPQPRRALACTPGVPGVALAGASLPGEGPPWQQRLCATAGARHAPLTRRARPHVSQGAAATSFPPPHGRPVGFGASASPFPRLSQLGSSPGPFGGSFNPLQARAATAARAARLRGRTCVVFARCARRARGAASCGLRARRTQLPTTDMWARRRRACCCNLRLLRYTQVPTHHSLAAHAANRGARPPGGGGGFPSGGGSGGGGASHAVLPLRTTPKDGKPVFRAAQPPSGDDKNKKGCSSTYRGVRQRPWGRRVCCCHSRCDALCPARHASCTALTRSRSPAAGAQLGG
jgi:hypothetical protein